MQKSKLNTCLLGAHDRHCAFGFTASRLGRPLLEGTNRNRNYMMPSASKPALSFVAFAKACLVGRACGLAKVFSRSFVRLKGSCE